MIFTGAISIWLSAGPEMIFATTSMPETTFPNTA